MKAQFLWLLALEGVVAFPSVFESVQQRATTGCTTNAACNQPFDVSDEIAGLTPDTPTAAQKASAARDNCGFVNFCTVFDAEEQLVSTTGAHAYQSPTAGDIRGPCPGLNAAANHGYLPRNGAATIQQTITGLGAMYGMSTDLAAVLAAYAIVIDGDVITGTWSIGGPQATLLGPLLGTGQGISWSHNKYEGDTSIGRCDAYVNGGDAHSLSTVRYAYAYSSGLADDRYTFDKFAQEFTKNTFRSIGTNPYYFTGAFSTTLVSPAAYNFVIAFMSNHTAAEPGGYLDGSTFKQFFGITGEYPNFTWHPGQERMPDNWYRRPSSQPYEAAGGVFGDLAPNFLAYPNAFRFGGNVNGVNTYTGIDLANFTNGVFSADTLFQGNNLACFGYAAIQQAVPDSVSTGVLSKALALINPVLDNAFGALACPQVSQFNDNNIPSYPGRTYRPDGPATNC